MAPRKSKRLSTQTPSVVTSTVPLDSAPASLPETTTLPPSSSKHHKKEKHHKKSKSSHHPEALISRSPSSHSSPSPATDTSAPPPADSAATPSQPTSIPSSSSHKKKSKKHSSKAKGKNVSFAPSHDYVNDPPSNSSIPAYLSPHLGTTPTETHYSIFVDNNGGWFKNKMCIAKWTERFHERPLACVSFVQASVLASSSRDSFRSFFNIDYGTLLTPPDVVFPRLVRLFYTNLTQTVEDGFLSLHSIVKGTPILLTIPKLCDILAIPRPSTAPDLSLRTLSSAQELYLRSSSRAPSQSHLTLPARLAHAFLARVLLPRSPSSLTTVTGFDLCLIKKMLHNQPLGLPYLMFHHIIHLSNTTRYQSLPYANWLTLVFDAYNVDFSGEERLTQITPTLTEKTFDKLGICRDDFGTWILSSSPPTEAQHVKDVSENADDDAAASPDTLENILLMLDFIARQVSPSNP